MKRGVIDQMGSRVEFSFPPVRIISLVPSQTELLFDLGLDQRVVGITKFCVRPAMWMREKKTVIGGTKNIRIEEVAKLAPDLIIGNREENSKQDIEALKDKYPVWMSDISSLSDAVSMIGTIGMMTDADAAAASISSDIRKAFKSIQKRQGTALYLIWKKPWMAGGTGTFINEMLGCIGLTNIVGVARYPGITEYDIANCGADFIFLSTEPYPFKNKDVEEIRSLSKISKVMLVDGEMFSWYGSRLRLAPAYFNSLAL